MTAPRGSDVSDIDGNTHLLLPRVVRCGQFGNLNECLDRAVNIHRIERRELRDLLSATSYIEPTSRWVESSTSAASSSSSNFASEMAPRVRMDESQ